MKIGSFELPALYLLFAFIPVSVFLEFTHGDPTWIFVTSGLAIVPLAGLMGKATEHLAGRMGAGIGGLLNATFGNMAELIIALIALKQGLIDVVKASLTGSIIGNILLVLGLALLAGGIRHPRQTFNGTAQGMGATLLTLSVIGLVIPALFMFLSPTPDPDLTQNLSLAIAVVLFVTYVLSLLFSLKTHQHLYGSESDHHHEGDLWSRKKSALWLVVATVGVAIESEFLVGSVEATSERFGLTDVFVGVILVAIVGNAAEHSTAVLVAMKNKMDLSLNIAIGSSIQVALLIAPVLVFVSYLFTPMDLIFTPLEVVAVVLSVWVVGQVAQDGESHWMEGALLVAVYVILGVAFFFHPATSG